MKKLFSLLTLALLSMTVWGKVVTVDFAGMYESNTNLTTINAGEGITLTFSKANGSNVPAYNANAQEVRMYKNTTLSVAAPEGYTITNIDFTFTQSMWQQSPSSANVGTIGSDGNWTGSANSVLFTNNYEVNTQIRFNKMVITFSEPVVEGLVAPVFDPNGGEFSGSIEVTVSCATEDASIMLFKVVDGQDVYQDYYFQSGTFYVNETSTYRAYSYKGDDMSDYTTVTFTKVTPQVATPTFNPASGTEFEGELDVTISCATPGATIMYEYGDVIDEAVAPVTITLTDNATITAIASLEGYDDSEAATATYTKKEVTPLDPWQGTETYLSNRDKGNYTGTQAMNDIVISKESRPGVSFTISRGMAADNGYRIYKNETITFTSLVGNITAIEFVGVQDYAVNNFGEVEGMTYDGNNGTWIGDAATVSFKAVNAQVRATEIRITIGQEAIIVSTPVITPENNTVFAGEQEVTITCSTEGAQIYYTIGEGDETLYEGPFNIDASCTIKAYAKVGDAKSPEVSATYHLGTEISTIAEGNTVGQYYIYNGEAVVTYQNGSYTWIRDNSGSGLIYGYQVPQLSQGVVLKDGWTANYTVYKNVPEFQYPMGVEASEDTVAVAPYVRENVTTDNVNEYVVLKGITVLTDESNTKKFYNAADSLILYNQFNIADSILNIENGKTYDVEGIVYIFNETTLELYITKVTEVTAQQWALGDVNHDTFVNVADVTALIKYVLTSGDEPEEFYTEQANVDGDAAGVLNVADVTALIQLVLNQ